LGSLNVDDHQARNMAALLFGNIIPDNKKLQGKIGFDNYYAFGDNSDE